LGSLAGVSPQAIGVQAASAIDVVLHLENTSTGRRLTQIGVLELRSAQLQVRVAAESFGVGLRLEAAWPQLLEKLHR